MKEIYRKTYIMLLILLLGFVAQVQAKECYLVEISYPHPTHGSIKEYFVVEKAAVAPRGQAVAIADASYVIYPLKQAFTPRHLASCCEPANAMQILQGSGTDAPTERYGPLFSRFEDGNPAAMFTPLFKKGAKRAQVGAYAVRYTKLDLATCRCPPFQVNGQLFIPDFYLTPTAVNRYLEMEKEERLLVKKAIPTILQTPVVQVFLPI